MGKKDFQKGMEAGAKPFEAKFEQMSNDTHKVGRDINQKLDGLGDVMDVVIDDISDLQKQSLYQLNTPFDLKEDLDEDEKELLAAFLLRLSEMAENNKYQKQFIRSVNGYIGVTSPQMGFDLAGIEHIESLSAQKAILQAAMEYLFLETEDFSRMEDFQEEVFDYFSINKKGIKEIQTYIQTIYQAVGKDGITEKYGFVPEVPEEDVQEAKGVEEAIVYDGSDISEACADQIHVREYYVELNECFVYLEGGADSSAYIDDKRILYRVDKATGKKEKVAAIMEIDFANYCKDVQGLCGCGNMVYVLLCPGDTISWAVKIPHLSPEEKEKFQKVSNKTKKLSIYQINIKTGNITEFYEEGSGNAALNSYSIQCCNKFVAFYRDSRMGLPQLKIINVQTREMRIVSNVEGFKVIGETIYFKDSDPDEIKRYNYQTNLTETLCKTADKFGNFLKDSTTPPQVVLINDQKYLLQITSWDNAITYLNLENPEVEQVGSIPGVSKAYFIAGYQDIYYFQKDSSLSQYNFLTGEQATILSSSEGAYTTDEGIFKPKIKYHLDVREANVIGKWLYYQQNHTTEVYKVTLDAERPHEELFMESFSE